MLVKNTLLTLLAVAPAFAIPVAAGDKKASAVATKAPVQKVTKAAVTAAEGQAARDKLQIAKYKKLERAAEARLAKDTKTAKTLKTTELSQEKAEKSAKAKATKATKTKAQKAKAKAAKLAKTTKTADGVTKASKNKNGLKINTKGLGKLSSLKSGNSLKSGSSLKSGRTPRTGHSLKSGRTPRTGHSHKSGLHTGHSWRSGRHTGHSLKSGLHTGHSLKSGFHTGHSLKSGLHTGHSLKSGPHTGHSLKSAQSPLTPGSSRSSLFTPGSAASFKSFGSQGPLSAGLGTPLSAASANGARLKHETIKYDGKGGYTEELTFDGAPASAAPKSAKLARRSETPSKPSTPTSPLAALAALNKPHRKAAKQHKHTVSEKIQLNAMLVEAEKLVNGLEGQMNKEPTTFPHLKQTNKMLRLSKSRLLGGTKTPATPTPAKSS